jgi:HEPN domain-containing protein
MIDLQKQIDYWRIGAQEDWEVASDLVERGKPRHGLFFAHLALEKILKAHVCKTTGDHAPKIHRLVRLSQLAGIETSPQQIEVLSQMNLYQMEGRYPKRIEPLLTAEDGESILRECRKVYQWLTKQL